MFKLRTLCCNLAITLSLTTTGAWAETNTMEEKLQAAYASGELSGLHSVLVMRDGKVLSEAYFTGEDQRWGDPLGEVKHGPDTLHDLRSVTKSVVGLLYGIALAEGVVPSIDEPLLAQFPEYPDLSEDPDRRAILIRHVLSMKMGTQWNEDLPYSDPKNSEIAMEMAKDRYRFVLDRPMVNVPGDWWTYNGGATAIIGRLISKGAGMPLDEYANQKLFKPLGISRYEWVGGRDGEPSAASGLRLTTHDLAKIGQLVANKGLLNGQQVAPASWIDAMLTPSATLDGLRYGFQWWLAPDNLPPTWVAGFGNGGQRLTVAPQSRTVVVSFAGRYNEHDAWKLPLKVILEFVNPFLKAEKESSQ